MSSTFQLMAVSPWRKARTLYGVGLAVCLLVLAGCGENKMMLDGQMKGEMKGEMKAEMKADVKGELQTTLKLDGPMTIQLQVQGPTVKYDGVYISDKLLDRVKLGETRADWLLAVFGEPTGRGPLADGEEIWKWAYRPLEQIGSAVSVFGGGSKTEPSLQPSTAFVRLRGGAVVEKWRD